MSEKSPEPELTLGGCKIWPRELRESFFKRRNEIAIPLMDGWNFSSSGTVHQVGSLHQILASMKDSEKVTPEQFALYYLNDSALEREHELIALKSEDRKTRYEVKKKYPKDGLSVSFHIWMSHGRSDFEIGQMINSFYKKLEAGDIPGVEPGTYSKEQVANLFFSRLFDSTVVGYQRELKAQEWLKDSLSDKGVEVRPSDWRTDVGSGIDFELYYRNRLIVGIQVKGYNFTNSTVKGEVDSHIRLSNQLKSYTQRTGAAVSMCFISNHGGSPAVINNREIIGLVKNKIHDIDSELEKASCLEKTAEKAVVDIDRSSQPTR